MRSSLFTARGATPSARRGPGRVRRRAIALASVLAVVVPSLLAVGAVSPVVQPAVAADGAPL